MQATNVRQVCSIIRQAKETSAAVEQSGEKHDSILVSNLKEDVKICTRASLEAQPSFQDTIYEEEETLAMFPSINLACAQTLIGKMEKTRPIEEYISNVQFFMPLVESLSKKCADGYLVTIEAVIHARLPPVRSPSPEPIYPHSVQENYHVSATSTPFSQQISSQAYGDVTPNKIQRSFAIRGNSRSKKISKLGPSFKSSVQYERQEVRARHKGRQPNPLEVSLDDEGNFTFERKSNSLRSKRSRSEGQTFVCGTDKKQRQWCFDLGRDRNAHVFLDGQQMNEPFPEENYALQYEDSSSHLPVMGNDQSYYNEYEQATYCSQSICDRTVEEYPYSQEQVADEHCWQVPYKILKRRPEKRQPYLEVKMIKHLFPEYYL